ncbi:MAG: MoaD family protein [Candidatus Bathyarchaeota archaeon]|nr:MoaD family protein [Candidatus Bathyarchaeota archaeon]
MKVKFRFFASLREVAGEKERILELDKPMTVYEALNVLSNFYGEKFREEVFEAESLAEKLTILVNGSNINTLSGLKTMLNDGDEVSIFPPIVGG